jgi:predicted nucleic acid-binding protein
MYLLDTNVVSELRRKRRAHPNVVKWAAAFPVSRFYLSTICLAELELGVLLMERRDPLQGAQLRRWFEVDVLSRFEGRILVVDQPVARCCAELHVPSPRPAHDALIAATAIVHGLTLATRNTVDFEPMGLEMVNPWIVD